MAVKRRGRSVIPNKLKGEITGRIGLPSSRMAQDCYIWRNWKGLCRNMGARYESSIHTNPFRDSNQNFGKKIKT